MAEITYLNETLWPGILGHFAVLTSFVFAILSAYAFYKSEKQASDKSWLNLGRIAYLIHGLATFLVIFLLFYVMLNRMYEYQYAWAHVSDDLPFRYLFSAFWEDQAGSFLLWAFWHIILGGILIWKARNWEAPVMFVIALIQVFIISMILGIHLIPGLEGYRLGSSPFMLLRETMDAPIFSNLDYLKLITGKGLNPLLQNYWMTIHPPTLFLGFASTSVPFAYAFAAMWRKDPKGWLNPVLPWALFSASILGTGILMGAAWAYEALSFGGYWAWDPVENMSLVPWLILIAGLHTNLIARQNGHSIRATLLFYGLTFVMILYSTFMTRSGVLQDSSVHAFTEMGLEWQLVGFLFFFAGIFKLFFFKSYRVMAVRKDEEPFLSREFWMFIGSLVFLFSSILITFTTSIPVFNKISDLIGWVIGQDLSHWHRTLPLDPIEHFNKFQFWIAILIGLLSGFTQYLRYDASPVGDRRKALIIRQLALVGATLVFCWFTWRWLGYISFAFHLLTFSAWYTVVANTDYLISFLKGNLSKAASNLAHLGFGLMLVGIIASGIQKQYISQNRFAMEGILSQDIINKNVLLFKNSPLLINGYKVTYLTDTLVGHIRTYEIQFDKLGENGEVVESFKLYPDIQFDNDFQKQAASNPSTKRYFWKDIFTHISGLPPELSDIERAKAKEDSLRYLPVLLYPGKSENTERLAVMLTGSETTTTNPDYTPEERDIVYTANLQFYDEDFDTTYVVQPTMVLRDNLVYNFPAKNNDLQVKTRLNDKIFNGFMTGEEELDFQTIQLSQGQSVSIFGYDIKLEGYKNNPTDPLYEAVKGDIAVAARLKVVPTDNPTRYSEEVQPIFLIRGSSPFGLRTYSPGTGLHFRFMSINPDEGQINLLVAKQPDYNGAVVEIAENYTRDDYLVLEAILFPGINFFWLGSSMMMLALGLGAWSRRKLLR